MMRLNDTSKVRYIAQRLGLEGTDDLVSEIVDYAISRVEDFASQFTISTLDGLMRLVAAHVDVRIERICSSDDAEKMALRYGKADPSIGLFIKREFLSGGGTEGLLLENPYRRIKPGARRYVAFIDVRGKQRDRAYFTIWHELAHLLIIPPGEPYAPKRRSPTEEKKQVDPEERLVDIIAGKLAFYKPLFAPMLNQAVFEEGELNFKVIERAAGEASTRAITASLWATARATIRVIDRPACLVEVERRHKASVKRHLQKASGDLFDYKPEKELRLKQCVHNEEARRSGSVELRKNMRVPKKSVLTDAHCTVQGRRNFQNMEDQSWWATSSEGALSPLPLKICAVRRGSYTYGLVMPMPV